MLNMSSGLPVFEKGYESDPLPAGDGADQGDLERNNFPNKGRFAVDYEFFEAADREVEVALGYGLIFGIVHLGVLFFGSRATAGHFRVRNRLCFLLKGFKLIKGRVFHILSVHDNR